MPIPKRAGKTGNFLPDTIVKINTAMKSPKAKKRIKGLVSHAGILKLLICNFLLTHVTALITVLIGQTHPQ
jgi:hypothetical protein